MEAIIISTIIGIGYYLNKDERSKNNQLKNENIISPNELPSGDNIYSSRHLDKVQENEFKKATQNYKDSENPKKTGIINGDTYYKLKFYLWEFE